MHDWDWLLWSFMGVTLVVILAVGMPLERWLTRRRREESGWADWRRTAATLPRSERWRVYWANATGRAVSEPRLAQLAVRRAEALLRLRRKPSRAARRYLLFVGLYPLVRVVLAVLDHKWSDAVVLHLAITVLWIHQATVTGLRERSVAANRTLAGLP